MKRLQLPVHPLSKSQLLLVWLGILIFPSLTYLHSRYGLVWTSQQIPTSGIRSYGDIQGSHAVAIKLNTGGWMDQTPTFPSPAIVMENGVPLGHGNAGLQVIASKGEGRYTLFDSQLIFSASDNSDPRTNGRTYELYWPLPIDYTLAGLQYFGATIGTSLFLKWVFGEGYRPRLGLYERSPLLRGALVCAVWGLIVFGEGWPVSGKLNRMFSVIFLLIGVLLIFQQQRRWLRFLLTLLLFFLPLSLLWKSGSFEYHGVVGLLPWSDAIGYYTDALRLQLGLPFSQLSSGRPLFPGLAAVLLAITQNNLQLTLLLLCMLNAAAVYLLAEKVKQHFGTLLSSLVLVLLFYDYTGYGFVGKLMTENMGLFLGALALALLISGAHRNNAVLTGLGSFSLALALNARAGAFFSLIALAAWGCFAYRRTGSSSLRPLLAILIGTAAGFFSNLLFFRAVGTPGAVPFFNVGSTLFGLASGYKNWAYVFSLYPETSVGEHFQLAMELIQREPALLLIGITRAYRDYFSPAVQFRYLYFHPESDQWAASWILYALALLSLIALIRHRQQTVPSLLLWLIAGIVASVPFAPPIDDGIRAMTATIPISVLALGFVLRQPTESPPVQHQPDWIDRTCIGLSMAVTGLTIVGAIAVKSQGSLPLETPALACGGASVPVSLRVAPGSYLTVVPDDSLRFSYVPRLRESDFRQALRENYLFPDLGATLEGMQAGDALLMGINRTDLQLIFLITQTTTIQDPDGLNFFCAQSTGFQNFYVDRTVEKP